MADGVGLLVAYNAFEQAMQSQPRSSVDGLTPEHRFFIAYADGMAYLYSQRGARNLGAPELVEQTPRLRVNLAVSSLPAFARVFGCKVGDAMVAPLEQQINRLD